MLLRARQAMSVVGCDVNPFAVKVTKLNLILNGSARRRRIVAGNLFGPLGNQRKFNVILFHPPYRLCPESVRYPNAIARVGPGRDGLDLVRRFVEEVDDYLAEDGWALLSCEFPASGTVIPFLDELAAMARRFRWLVQVERRRCTLVEDQSRTTAEKCALLNPDHSLEELTAIIAAYYEKMRFSDLVLCFVRITKTTSTQMEVLGNLEVVDHYLSPMRAT